MQENPLRRALSGNDVSRYTFRARSFEVDEDGTIRVIDETRFRRSILVRSLLLPDATTMPLDELKTRAEKELNRLKTFKLHWSSMPNLSTIEASHILNGLDPAWFDTPTVLQYAGRDTEYFLMDQFIENAYGPHVGYIPKFYTWFPHFDSRTSMRPPVPDQLGFYKRCIKDLLHRPRECNIMVMPFVFSEDDQSLGHAEMILLENCQSEHLMVYRFDPNGGDTNYFTATSSIFVDTYLKQFLDACLAPKTWQWGVDGLASSCPRVLASEGPQRRQSHIPGEMGFCQTWILLWIHLRLKNRNMTVEQINRYFQTLSPDQLSALIQNFAQFASKSSTFRDLDPKKDRHRHSIMEQLLTSPYLDELSIRNRRHILSLNDSDMNFAYFLVSQFRPFRRLIERNYRRFISNTDVPWDHIMRLYHLMQNIYVEDLPIYVDAINSGRTDQTLSLMSIRLERVYQDITRQIDGFEPSILSTQLRKRIADTDDIDIIRDIVKLSLLKTYIQKKIAKDPALLDLEEVIARGGHIDFSDDRFVKMFEEIDRRPLN